MTRSIDDLLREHEELDKAATKGPFQVERNVLDDLAVCDPTGEAIVPLVYAEGDATYIARIRTLAPEMAKALRRITSEMCPTEAGYQQRIAKLTVSCTWFRKKAARYRYKDMVAARIASDSLKRLANERDAAIQNNLSLLASLAIARDERDAAIARAEKAEAVCMMRDSVDLDFVREFEAARKVVGASRGFLESFPRHYHGFPGKMQWWEIHALKQSLEAYDAEVTKK